MFPSYPDFSYTNKFSIQLHQKKKEKGHDQNGVTRAILINLLLRNKVNVGALNVSYRGRSSLHNRIFLLRFVMFYFIFILFLFIHKAVASERFLNRSKTRKDKTVKKYI